MKPPINYPGAVKWSVIMMMCASSCSQKLPDKPNILLILTDQQSSESMSSVLGTQYLNTPNMDYLAEHGISFTHAYCSNPLCMPSRSSMFTGRYPHEVGLQTNEQKMMDPLEFPLFGKMFETAGYETGYIGKWHLPFNIKDKESHGFNFLAQNKVIGVDTLIPGSAIEFLTLKREKPFLLVVSFINPHNICEWARGDKLPDGEIGSPPPGDQCPPLRSNHAPSKNETDIMNLTRTSYQASRTFPVSGFSDEKWRQYIWAYYRMIEKVDGQIGQILANLRETGQDKNTVIVFLSDHGDCQGAHGWNQKTVFYDESAKVPLIISHRAIKKGKSDILVQTGIDLLPTLADIANIPLTAPLPGMSLKAILTHGKPSSDRKYIVVSDKLIQGEIIDGYKPEPEGRMIRDKNFKYWIYNEGSQKESLFDLQQDPGEMDNLAQDTAYKDELEYFRTTLAEWTKTYNDSFLLNMGGMQ